jgi:hypothetical protein
MFEVEYVLPRPFARGAIGREVVEANTSAEARRAVGAFYRGVLILRVNRVGP